jgi:hypothetical protein
VLIGVFGDNFFSWSCLSKVSDIDDKVLSWFRRVGCNEIHLGIESGSGKMLKSIIGLDKNAFEITVGLFYDEGILRKELIAIEPLPSNVDMFSKEYFS